MAIHAAEADAPLAQRRHFRRPHSRLDVRCPFDLWDDDSQRTHVEHRADHVRIETRDAHERRDPSRVGRANHLGEQIRTHVILDHVDPYEVQPSVCKQPDRRRRRDAPVDAERWPPFDVCLTHPICMQHRRLHLWPTICSTNFTSSRHGPASDDPPRRDGGTADLPEHTYIVPRGRGPNCSRSTSPSKLNPRTVNEIVTDGPMSGHRLRLMKRLASWIMLPHEGTGAGVPCPRKLRRYSRIASPSPSGPRTCGGAMTFGRIASRSARNAVVPGTCVARTYSVSRIASVLLRASLANRGVYKKPGKLLQVRA